MVSIVSYFKFYYFVLLGLVCLLSRFGWFGFLDGSWVWLGLRPDFGCAILLVFRVRDFVVFGCVILVVSGFVFWCFLGFAAVL